MSMNESSSRDKNFLITTAGVIIFLAAGIFTMLFFPERKTIITNKEQASQTIAIASSEILPVIESKTRQEIKIEISKPKSDWYVYVTGEVKKPGYYKISADSRVFQAVEAAGGFTDKADIASVNMASRLTDGFQVNVLAKGAKKISVPVTVPGMQARPAETVVIRQQAQAKTQTRTNAKEKSNNGQVNINSATAKDLERLSGIGPAIAKRIIDYRNKNGNFSSPEDLLKVRGIGKAKLEKMRSQILIR